MKMETTEYETPLTFKEAGITQAEVMHLEPTDKFTIMNTP